MTAAIANDLIGGLQAKAQRYPDFFRLADGLLSGIVEFEAKDSNTEWGKQPITPTVLEDANVVTSRIGVGNTHRVAIDLDMDAALIPSTTQGHYHLIVDKELTWEQYEKLLKALEEVGLIQPGYLRASLKRGATVLRTPWTKKK